MQDRLPDVLRLVALAALVTATTTLGATPARGISATELVALLVAGTVAHALLLSPTLALRDERGAARAMTAPALLLGCVPLLRAGTLVNDRPATLALLVAAALASAGLATWVARVPTPVVALLALVVGATTLLRHLPGRVASGALGPDVFLVTIDTLRADHVGAYGAATDRTRTLDTIAGDGARFARAFATAPLTGPSHTAMLTGRWPLATGVVANGTPLATHPETLARVFAGAGYATGGFVGGFPLSARFGFDQGFDVFDDDFGAMPGAHELAAVQLFDLLRPSNLPRERRADRVLDAALTHLARTPSPTFLWIHLFDPHAPYEAPDTASPPYPEGWRTTAAEHPEPYSAAYAGEISYVDRELTRLFGAIEQRGRPAYLVVVSDHGESLGEHGVFFDHGDDLFDPSLQVPWLVRGPGIAPGTVVSAQVSTVDLAPTVLALAGVADPFPRDGHSRAPELLGGPGVDGDVFATTLGARHRDPPLDHALRRVDAKCYARHGTAPVLYDLIADPSESTDATSTRPDLAHAVCGALANAARGAVGLPTASDADVDAALRALGYLQ